MPKSAYTRKRAKNGRMMYFRFGKLVSKAKYLRGKGLEGKLSKAKRKSTVRKTVKRRRTMAKRRTSRRRSNPMGSYSKQNIALGTLLGQVAPKFVPGATSWLPLVGLLPKSPTAVKVMSWMIASKVVSDRFINR
jgi:hypothetical protein